MSDKLYTLAEIKRAFWEEFKGAGELCFPSGMVGADGEWEMEWAVQDQWNTFSEKLGASDQSFESLEAARDAHIGDTNEQT